MRRTSSVIVALCLLVGCKPAPEPTVKLDPESSKALAQEIAQAMPSEEPRAVMGASTTSGSPNFNVTDYQNGFCKDYEPAGSVTWVDGGTFSDGGPTGLVAVPVLPGRQWLSCWFHCPGTTTGNITACVDGVGFGGTAAQTDVCLSGLPCDTFPLPATFSRIYQNGMDAGSGTVTPYCCY